MQITPNNAKDLYYIFNQTLSYNFIEISFVFLIYALLFEITIKSEKCISKTNLALTVLNISENISN